jgi:hypothetical protein
MVLAVALAIARRAWPKASRRRHYSSECER